MADGDDRSGLQANIRRLLNVDTSDYLNFLAGFKIGVPFNTTGESIHMPTKPKQELVLHDR